VRATFGSGFPDPGWTHAPTWAHERSQARVVSRLSKKGRSSDMTAAARQPPQRIQLSGRERVRL